MNEETLKGLKILMVIFGVGFVAASYKWEILLPVGVLLLFFRNYIEES